MKEELEKNCYEYSGPIYVSGHKVSDKWEGKTYAESPKKALNNFRYRLGIQFATYGVELVPECLHECDDEILIDQSIKTYAKCGTRLNDSGECPLCDLGDESVLDEGYRQDVWDALSKAADQDLTNNIKNRYPEYEKE